jgi:hypothetical protein
VRGVVDMTAVAIAIRVIVAHVGDHERTGERHGSTSP